MAVSSSSSSAAQVLWQGEDRQPQTAASDFSCRQSSSDEPQAEEKEAIAVAWQVRQAPSNGAAAEGDGEADTPRNAEAPSAAGEAKCEEEDNLARSEGLERAALLTLAGDDGKEQLSRAGAVGGLHGARPRWRVASRRPSGGSYRAADMSGQEDDGESSLSASDFESLSLSSEIPEAIDEDATLAASLAVGPRVAWTQAAASPQPGDALATPRVAAAAVPSHTLGAQAAALSVEATAGGGSSGSSGAEAPTVVRGMTTSASVPATPRTLVRRARVRGTVCLPTAQETPASARQRRPESFLYGSPLLPDGALSARNQRPATASGRLGTWGVASTPHLPGVKPLQGAAARFEARSSGKYNRDVERALEALAAAKATHEALLAQQAREAADRMAVLQAIDDDRFELAERFREAQAENGRLRAELWDCLRENEGLQKELEVAKSSSARNTCVVCLDASAAFACVPCGHLALCEDCVRRWDRRCRRCPVCRDPSECAIHIFLP
eukprot:TRINITY_DN29303_c0_g1_i2.p1 TRINITY_DN29303_c0_g1~~TRINITY_DN29303_c0_g1_i2.p1  ORF type:complete len:498 (+),score=120.01 TRINITY_DN29303_c0_g1_i2:120-1613(+)